MTGKEIFKIWAPKGAKWTEWVRPVPFVSIDDFSKLYSCHDFTIPNITYISKLPEYTAIIVNLPGTESIKEGIALAKIGFRPIPLYNGTNEQQGAMPTTNNHAVQSGLIYGAIALQKRRISNTAPPAFLLDSNRTNKFKMNQSVFDNSWDIYDQDFPSAEYLLKNGIKKIIIIGGSIQRDLSKILYKFQKKGITILFTNGYQKVKKIKLYPWSGLKMQDIRYNFANEINLK